MRVCVCALAKVEKKRRKSPHIYVFCANLSLIKEEKTERKENALSFSIFSYCHYHRRLSVLLKKKREKTFNTFDIKICIDEKRPIVASGSVAVGIS